MADFSTRATDVSSVITPAATILQPVDRTNEARALNNIADAVDVGAKVVQTWRANSATIASNKVASDFAVRMTDLADIVTQDPSRAGEVSTRRSALYKEYVTAHPESKDDIDKAYNNVLSQTGIQRIKTNEESILENDQAMRKDLIDNGFLAKDAQNDPVAVKNATQAFQDFKLEVNNLKINNDRYTTETAKLALDDKRRETLQKEASDNAVAITYRVVNKGFVALNNKFANIKSDIAKERDPNTIQQMKAEGIAALKQEAATYRAQMTTGAIGKDVTNLTTALTQVDELIKTFESELDGSIDSTVAKNRYETLWNKSKIAALEGVPADDRKLLAASEMMGNPIALTTAIQGVAEHYLANQKAALQEGSKTSDILGGNDQERKNVQGYMKVLAGAITESNQGYIYKTPEQKEAAKVELKGQVENTLKGVQQYAGTVNNAEDYQAVIDFLANPEVGKYIKSAGLSPEAAAGATEALKAGYESQVVPMLKDRIKEMYKAPPNVGDISKWSSLTSGRAAAGAYKNIYDLTTSSIEPTVENGKFGFRLKAGVDPSMSADPNVQKLLKTFNSDSASVVMNKMLTAQANLNGTDVASEFDAIKDQVFPAPTDGVDATTTGSTTKDPGFDLGSLAEEAGLDPQFASVDNSTLAGDVAEIAKGVDIGETAGTGDYSTLLGNAQKDGKPFAGVDITKKTVDELIDFTAGGGAYAEYSKGVVNRMATPMGRYQIVGKTLRSLKNKMGLDGSEVFSPELQDKMFLQLLKGRGYFDYKAGKLSKQDFLSNLKNEWEGLHNKKAAAIAGAALNEG